MKKHVLLGVAISIGISAYAQQTSTSNANFAKVPAHLNKAVKKEKPGDFSSNSNVPGFYTPVKSTGAATMAAAPITRTFIGNTLYQLQTNSSVYQRLVNNGDGTLSAVWTMGSTGSDRGTGYNYFDGSSWDAIPSVRIENEKTGFPSLAVTPSGVEVIAAHNLTGDVNINRRTTKGTGAWTQTYFGQPNLWVRLTNGGANGETIYKIGHTSGISQVPVMGQDGAIAFSRSTDAGQTWDIYQQLIPGIDSSFYLGFGGDAYAIDAKGSNVAIVAGGETVDLVMVKSTDNGQTWTKTIIDPFPIPFYQMDDGTDINNDGVYDTIPTNDGSIAVLLDNSGMAHVWFGYQTILDDDTTDGSYSFFPSTSGLMYWNEGMGSNPPVLIADLLDVDNSGVIELPTAPAGAFPFGMYYTSLTSFPNAGIDANGVLYLAYSGVVENTNTGADKAVRNVYAMKSTDNGSTWSAPTNVTNDDFTEDVFPSVARLVDSNMHIVSQADDKAGHGVSGTNDPENAGASADIVYARVPVNEIGTTGINENTSANVINVYPNPASSFVNVNFNVTNSDVAVIKIYNLLGAEVASFSNELSAGTHSLSINVENYTPGMYVIATAFAGNTYTKRVVVE